MATAEVGEQVDETCSCAAVRFVEEDSASQHSSLVRYVSSECLPDWRTYSGYNFENLVMSGGGSKGYAYIGALKVTKAAFTPDTCSRIQVSRTSNLYPSMSTDTCRLMQVLSSVLLADTSGWRQRIQVDTTCTRATCIRCKRCITLIFSYSYFIKIHTTNVHEDKTRGRNRS